MRGETRRRPTGSLEAGQQVLGEPCTRPDGTSPGIRVASQMGTGGHDGIHGREKERESARCVGHWHQEEYARKLESPTCRLAFWRWTGLKSKGEELAGAGHASNGSGRLRGIQARSSRTKRRGASRTCAERQDIWMAQRQRGHSHSRRARIDAGLPQRGATRNQCSERGAVSSRMCSPAAALASLDVREQFPQRRHRRAVRRRPVPSRSGSRGPGPCAARATERQS
jgi:hypothetical protein